MTVYVETSGTSDYTKIIGYEIFIQIIKKETSCFSFSICICTLITYFIGSCYSFDHSSIVIMEPGKSRTLGGVVKPKVSISNCSVIIKLLSLFYLHFLSHFILVYAQSTSACASCSQAPS